MSREATARRLTAPLEGEDLKTASLGGGPPPPSTNAGPAISNARLGVFVFLGAEVMFFCGSDRRLFGLSLGERGLATPVSAAPARCDNRR